jgi:3-methylfumaryl-CoA hydratase
MEIDIAHLRGWIGRTQTDSQSLDARLVQQFNATLERPGDADSAEAPLLIHLCLTQPVAPMSALGRDGHPALGGFLPPVPLPRRMWAGGEFVFHAPLRVGDTVTRHSTILEVTHKHGRTGNLCFVTLEHRISRQGDPVLTERQDIVYRDMSPPRADAPTPPPAPEGSFIRHMTPSAVLLFRYSALTFNGHRIHYDRAFCTGSEGYSGLVVHGPLQATWLCHFAADIGGQAPTAFRFRSLSPVFDDADVTLHAAALDGGLRLWTARPGGPVAMEAFASW